MQLLSGSSQGLRAWGAARLFKGPLCRGASRVRLPWCACAWLNACMRGGSHKGGYPGISASELHSRRLSPRMGSEVQLCMLAVPDTQDTAAGASPGP